MNDHDTKKENIIFGRQEEDAITNETFIDDARLENLSRIEHDEIIVSEQQEWNINKTVLESESPQTIFINPPLVGKNAFSPGFSILIAISFMFACIWAPFSNLASLILQKRYSISNIDAGRYMAMEEGISLSLIAIVGMLSDIIGFKLYFVGFGTLLLAFSHILLFLNVSSPLVICIVLGLSGPFISCHFPCITYLVSHESLEIGFGIFTCVLNVAYTFSPIIVSILTFFDESYDTSEFFFIIVNLITFIFVCILGILNNRYKLKLNRCISGD